MSLRDANCYTLTIHQSKADPSIAELVESYGPGTAKAESRYARVRIKQDDEAYSSQIFDTLTGAHLASAGYELEKAKKRRLQLHGPDEDVPFEYTGRINFEWTFEFEGNKYRWTREVYGKDYICSLDRKPDPRVEICLARDASSKGPARLQILHYNIERFPTEIKDQRGLETLLVASLLCLLDAAEDRNAPSRSTSGSSKLVKDGKFPPTREKDVPPVPARPERVISEDDFEPDPHVLFVVIRTKTAQASQCALEVSLGVTRFRHREGLPELKQYVIEEEADGPNSTTMSGGRPGPNIIKLDDDPPKKLSPSNSISGKQKTWTPPPNIAIYLSTIELPDLKPGRREHLKHVASTSSNPKPIHSPTPSAPPPMLPPKEAATLPPPTNPSKRTSSFGRLFRTNS
uniref:Uncharacterized protein n=1 Tax=Kwoniella dejecticola CBS 10117 TaxID=1296121 RepID=A0A1A6AGK6_9TREE|nr:uncharacterized protein I303_01030 [Kwoniella dejecticola CBS 10117]OBR89205.1 hypothetical protein I303_01030 [Kwoniella dejecticola CBS 10117]